MKPNGQHISLWQRVNRFGIVSRLDFVEEAIRNSHVVDVSNVFEYFDSLDKGW